MLRRISPEASSWEATSRGPLLRLKKLKPAHWARLLSEEGYDARQGTDWSRWHHPEVERAVRVRVKVCIRVRVWARARVRVSVGVGVGVTVRVGDGVSLTLTLNPNQVERAAQREAGKDEYARRSHARRRLGLGLGCILVLAA